MEARGCGFFGMVLVSLVLALSVIACDDIGAPGFETPSAPSGIQGVVVLGPTCPGAESTPGANDPVPCVTPYSAQLVVLDGENAVAARVTSGADGTFRIDLPPGDYIVTPASGTDSYPIANPVSVTVVNGQYVHVEVNYDTGIR
jgi:hypothetical protein